MAKGPAPETPEQRAASLLYEPRVRYERTGLLPGVRERLRKARWSAGSRLGDLVYTRGWHTAGSRAEPLHYHPDRVWYQASGWSWLRRALRPEEVSPSDTFVDFGSGKGRVLLQAARYPFGRVVGVEISERLNDIARENLARAPRRTIHCGEVELVTADVRDYRIPDDLTVAYFYYPFVGEVFDGVIDRIVESMDRRPRRMRIVYAMPVLEERILRTERFEAVRSARIICEQFSHRVSLYDSVRR